MKYIKEFMAEYRYLKKNGMTEEAVEEFYTSVAYDAIASDWRYTAHNLSLFGNSDNGLSPDTFAYPRGSVRKANKTADELEAMEKGDSAWSSIKLIVVPLTAKERADEADNLYAESVHITRQLESREMQQTIRSMSERRQYILELMVDGWSQTAIAEKLGISIAAVCKHIKAIREALEPFYREEHWLKISR